MDLKAVYKKTQKGQEEMAHRAALGMRERTLLVMVDGKTTAAELLARAQHMPDPQGLLDKLIGGGFIEAEAIVAASPPPPPPPPAMAPAPATLSPQEQHLMQETMRFADRFLDQVLGPDAQGLAEAIAKSKTMAELRARIEKTRDVIEAMGKKRRAEEFWTGAEAHLSGRAPAAALPSAAPLPVSPPAPASAPPLAAPQASMQEAVRFARRYLNDVLGPDAEALVEAIENCKTLPELRARLEKTHEALMTSGSKRKAEEFRAGFETRLPPY